MFVYGRRPGSLARTRSLTCYTCCYLARKQEIANQLEHAPYQAAWASVCLPEVYLAGYGIALDMGLSACRTRLFCCVARCAEIERHGAEETDKQPDGSLDSRGAAIPGAADEEQEVTRFTFSTVTVSRSRTVCLFMSTCILPHSQVYGRTKPIGPSFSRHAGGWGGRGLLHISRALWTAEVEESIPTISKCLFLSHMQTRAPSGRQPWHVNLVPPRARPGNHVSGETRNCQRKVAMNGIVFEQTSNLAQVPKS